MADADVIIVGFRCAGAPLAYALHRAGVKVIAVERDPFFTDQPLSTHAIQPYGMKMFDRLGLGDVIRGLAPPNRGFRLQVEDSYMQVDLDGTTMDSRSPRVVEARPSAPEGSAHGRRRCTRQEPGDRPAEGRQPGDRRPRAGRPR